MERLQNGRRGRDPAGRLAFRAGRGPAPLSPSQESAARESAARKIAAPDDPSQDDARKSLRPPLKWAGGKRWQVPHLLPRWRKHSHRRLVEPFCGGLAVTLGLMPQRALLNDINPHLINFYAWVKKGLVVDIRMEKTQRSYYRYRTEFNDLLAAGRAETDRAALIFYYLNRTGYNGLCRFNRQGGFNVPYGRYKTINYPKDFLAYRRAFSKWEFVSKDFQELRLDRGDFVYADPPYDVEFTQYAKHGFTWEDQKRTAEWLAAHPGPVILSNQATDRILDLYASLGFDLEERAAPRFISCTGDRTPAREVLAVKNM